MTQNGPSGAALTTAQPPAPTHGTVNVNAPYPFDNEGGPTQLAWTRDLTGAIAHRCRVTHPPKRLLTTDPTIARVTARQETYIYEMVQAMFKVDTAKDNPTFEGRFWFTRGHKNVVSAYDAEAACRVLFEAVLNRCTIGYRGLDREDRLTKRNPEKVDIEGSCEDRINHVITALREWKSVCKDVLTSDFKIDQLANAPASVAKDKQKQKKNNKTKQDSTQNDRTVAVTAIQGTVAAAQAVAVGALPPVARAIPRQKKSNPPKNVDGGNQQSTAPLLQVQVDLASNQPTYDGRYDEQPLPLMGDASFRADHNPMPQGAPTYPSADSRNDFANPPAYDLMHPYGIQQQGQSFVSEAWQATPSALPNLPPHGFGWPHGTGGYGGGPGPINNFH